MMSEELKDSTSTTPHGGRTRQAPATQCVHLVVAARSAAPGVISYDAGVLCFDGRREDQSSSLRMPSVRGRSVMRTTALSV